MASRIGFTYKYFHWRILYRSAASVESHENPEKADELMGGGGGGSHFPTSMFFQTQSRGTHRPLYTPNLFDKNKTKQNKTKQNKTKQKTKQNQKSAPADFKGNNNIC